MKFYIAGPMTGLPDWNYPAFDAAAAKLRAEGHEVFSGSELFDGDASKSREVYMRLDFEAILRAEAVVALPGWKESPGASLEVAMARELKLPVYEW